MSPLSPLRPPQWGWGHDQCHVWGHRAGAGWGGASPSTMETTRGGGAGTGPAVGEMVPIAGVRGGAPQQDRVGDSPAAGGTGTRGGSPTDCTPPWDAAQPLTTGKWGGTSCPRWESCQSRGVLGCPRAGGGVSAQTPQPPCPGATKCTYPGAALPADGAGGTGGSAPLPPTASTGLHGHPPPCCGGVCWGSQGRCLQRPPGVTHPSPAARTLLDSPPPPTWQRCTPRPGH